ncbi:type VI secretion system baseplate subunit TssE [Paraburkholderia saeva]|jgi:type VI secretion system protein ImpF|uniref:IraD/Gp25-like domain-containing protein n=1 Tax=Paraburkholderia saeva TaxID=2777537 RepID=A0A9N8X397_9BURK|nr:type VI secretion system baseplate subunit TssE [Paraburkholderia saeva]CAG4890060.1 hypothetical protein R70241_00901 [Paraburkholderia saeva]CAG4897760.1 hypothetical protein R52603_02353 [Paraburkholderia saeva]CAG4912519.1 hypothetical protein LMG31841_04177 [Paraburkholderia saeva]
MLAIINGSPMPLFERLVAGDAAPSHEQWLEGDALRESVARELGRLLGTRSRLAFDAFATSEGTVIDYGVPDFSARSLQSGGDRDAIAAAIQHAITLFEPRLANVTVRFAGNAAQSAQPAMLVSGDLRMATGLARVAFELSAAGEPSADLHGTDHD